MLFGKPIRVFLACFQLHGHPPGGFGNPSGAGFLFHADKFTPHHCAAKMKEEGQQKHQFLRQVAPSVDTLVVRVKGNTPASVALLGKQNVEMDLNPRTATVLGIRDMRHAALGEQARHVLDEIYFGQYDGWPIKALYALLGLMPGLLSATGFVLWKKKPARKPAGARPAAAGTSRPIRTRSVPATTGAAEAGSH